MVQGTCFERMQTQIADGRLERENLFFHAHRNKPYTQQETRVRLPYGALYAPLA